MVGFSLPLTFRPLTTLILYHKGREKSRENGKFLFVNLYKHLARKMSETMHFAQKRQGDGRRRADEKRGH